MTRHAIEPEELQAYLDRELTPARRTELEQHLAQCAACATLLDDLRSVSAALQQWQVEPAPATLRRPALPSPKPARSWTWSWPTRAGWLRVGLAGGVAALFLWTIAIPYLTSNRTATRVAQNRIDEAQGLVDMVSPEPSVALEESVGKRSPQPSAPAAAPPALKPKDNADQRASYALTETLEREKVREQPESKSVVRLRRDAPAELRGELDKQEKTSGAGAVGGLVARQSYAAEPALADALEEDAARKRAAKVARLLAYHVTLTVEVKQFDPAKEKVEQVVAASGGYIAESSSAETPNQPRRADLILRIPSENLNAVLAELRALGRVVAEHLSSEEVADQIVDLEARLRNARATEQRLITVLKERTGKVRDVLAVEREIARTREEIERMDARRENLFERVRFSTLQVALTEEFQAALEPAPTGTGTRLRNAFVDGYERFVGLLLGFVFFFARYGLVLLFWAGLLAFAWRALRRPVLRLVSAKQ